MGLSTGIKAGERVVAWAFACEGMMGKEEEDDIEIETDDASMVTCSPTPSSSDFDLSMPNSPDRANSPVAMNVERSESLWQEVVECHQPVLFHIVGFLIGDREAPNDFVNLCCLSSRSFVLQYEAVSNTSWEYMFRGRWPTFYTCVKYLGASTWKGLYRASYVGLLQCTLEIFDRENKLGFAMAAMPAKVHYDRKTDKYVADYLSASEVIPEEIPATQEFRLRFVPPSVREALLLNGKLGYKLASYPYRVLSGISTDLEVGQGVELQWKMQLGSPFGWWYCRLESLRLEPDGRAVADVTFRHFPEESRWYRLQVTFGTSQMEPCDFGGYTGGLRPVLHGPEHDHWMRFFPKEPVVF